MENIMSYKFIKIKDPENEFDKTDITFEIKNEDVILDDLVEEFVNFLKAVGYSIKDLEIIKNGE